jgi:hypothetical protein
MVVGGRASGVREALEVEGFDVVDSPGVVPQRGDDVAEIAAGLREFERSLGDGAVERVVLTESSNRAVAAVLVATKMQLRVAAIRDMGADPGEGGAAWVNERVIESLADAMLSEDLAAIVGWLRDPRPAQEEGLDGP